jgi:KDO2-lipid IV(A) lauroyltransferase
VLKGAEWFGAFVFTCIRMRRKVVLDNLSKAFPEKSEGEILKIAKKTYQHFSKLFLEFLLYPKMSRKELLSICQIECKEQFDSLLVEGKGAVLVGGHFGNWELLGGIIALLGYPISAVALPQHNPLTDQLINQFRRKFGISLIPVGIAVRGIIRALRNNEFVALLADQDARQDGIFVDFLGRPSSTVQGPAVFSLKTGAPVFYGSAVRTPEEFYLIRGRSFNFDHLKGVTPENIREITEVYSAQLEKEIRQYPEQWFWMHKRWKTKPISTQN